MKNEQLIRRFQIERKKFDRSGIYAYTQRILAYNSNKIEGSTLNEEQTASLFDTGMLPVSNDYYRAKDIEETNGHFLMFNKMCIRDSPRTAPSSGFPPAIQAHP